MPFLCFSYWQCELIPWRFFEQICPNQLFEWSSFRHCECNAQFIYHQYFKFNELNMYLLSVWSTYHNEMLINFVQNYFLNQFFNITMFFPNFSVINVSIQLLTLIRRELWTNLNPRNTVNKDLVNWISTFEFQQSYKSWDAVVRSAIIIL